MPPVLRCPGCKIRFAGPPTDCDEDDHFYCQNCELNLIWDGEEFIAMTSRAWGWLRGASAYVY